MGERATVGVLDQARGRPLVALGGTWVVRTEFGTKIAAATAPTEIAACLAAEKAMGA